MPNWENNLHSYPEKHGLTIFGGLSDESLSYAFDYLVVWEDQAGALFWADDSGCSCPAPFEDYASVAELVPLNDYGAFADAATEWNAGYDGRAKDSDLPQLLAKVWATFRMPAAREAALND